MAMTIAKINSKNQLQKSIAILKFINKTENLNCLLELTLPLPLKPLYLNSIFQHESK